jgi:hypothetical protein
MLAPSAADRGVGQTSGVSHGEDDSGMKRGRDMAVRPKLITLATSAGKGSTFTFTLPVPRED